MPDCLCRPTGSTSFRASFVLIQTLVIGHGLGGLPDSLGCGLIRYSAVDIYILTLRTIMRLVQ